MTDKDIGGIKFTVDGDDSGLKRVDESMEGLQKTAKDTEKAIDKYGNALTDADKKAGRFIDKAGKMREANGRFVKSIELAERKTGKLGDTSVKTAKDIDQLKTEVKENGDQLKTAAGYATAFTAAVGTVTAIAAKAGKELNNMARLSGTSVEEFQKLAFGSNEVGVSTEKLGDIFKDARDKMGDFTLNAGGELKDFFDNVAPSVGYTAEQFKYMSGPEILQNLSNAMQAANIAGNEQINILESLANDAALLSPLLADNGKGFSDAAKRMEELNLVLSQTEVDGLVEVDKAFNELGTTIAKNTQRIVGENAEEIADAIKSVSEAIASATDFISENMDMIVKITTILGSGAAAWYAYRTAILVCTAAKVAFNAVSLGPIGLLVTTLGAAAGAMLVFADNTQTAQEKVDELTGSTQALTYAEKQLLATKLEDRARIKQEELDIMNKQIKVLKAQRAAETEIQKAGRGDDDGALGAMKRRAKLVEDEITALEKKAEQLKINEIISGNTAEKTARSAKQSNDDLQKLIDKFTPLQAEERELLAAQAELNEAYKTAGEDEVPKIARALIEVGNQLDVVRGKMNQLPLTQVNEEFQALVNALPTNIPRAQVAGFISVIEDGAEKALSGVPSDFATSIGAALVDQDFSSFGDMLAGQASRAIGTAATDTLIASGMSAAAGGFFGGIAGGAAGALITEMLDTTIEDVSKARQAIQGTGTILGSDSEKSSSIVNSLETSADALGDLIGINTDIRDNIGALSENIIGASGLIARDSKASMLNPSVGLSSSGASFQGAFETALEPLNALSFNLFDDIISGVGGFLGGGLFGSSKIVDDGIKIFGGSLNDIMQEVTAGTFTEVKKKSWFSSSSNTYINDASEALENQIDLIYSGIAENATLAAESLELDTSATSDAIQSYVFDAVSISLKGLDADEKINELNAVFSQQSDEFVGTVFDFVYDFQKAGEGQAETLNRLATQMQVADEITRQLGMTGLSGSSIDQIDSANSLAQMFGGASNLAASFSSFVDEFASDAQQFAIIEDEISRAFENNNLAMQGSREELYSYAQALDLNTESGREAFKALISLSGPLDDYYKSLEQQKEVMQQLNVRLADARGDDALVKIIQRTEELSDAVTPAEQSLLNMIYAAEDLAKETEAIASLQYRYNEAIDRADLNVLTQRAEELENAITPAEKSLLNMIYAAEDLATETETLTSLQHRYNDAINRTDLNVLTQRAEELSEAVTPAEQSILNMIYAAEDLARIVDFQKEYNALIDRDDLNDLIDYEARLTSARNEDERQIIESIRQQELLNEAREREISLFRDNIGALEDAADRELESLSERNKKIIESSSSQLDSMRDSLNKQIEVEENKADRELDRLKKQQDSFSEAESNSKSLINMLDSAMKTLGERSEDLQDKLFAQSFVDIQNAINTARATGELPDADLIERAVSQLSTAGSGEFETRVDRERESLEARKLLSDLNELSKDSLSDSEMQIKLLDDQIEQSKKSAELSISTIKAQIEETEQQHNELVAMLDEQYEQRADYYDTAINQMNAQLSALRGIQSSTASFASILAQTTLQSKKAETVSDAASIGKNASTELIPEIEIKESDLTSGLSLDDIIENAFQSRTGYTLADTYDRINSMTEKYGANSVADVVANLNDTMREIYSRLDDISSSSSTTANVLNSSSDPSGFGLRVSQA